MGSVGISFPWTAELDQVWGYTPSEASARARIGLFAHDQGLISDQLVQLRLAASLVPGVQERYAEAFAAPRQRHIDAMALSEDEPRQVSTPTLLHGVADRVIPLFQVPFRDEHDTWIDDFVDGQDIMAWATQGPIAGRSNEHLGKSDLGVIMLRRVLQEQLEIVEHGGDPLGVIRDSAQNLRIDLPQEEKKFGTGEGFRGEFLTMGQGHDHFSSAEPTFGLGEAGQPMGDDYGIAPRRLRGISSAQEEVALKTGAGGGQSRQLEILQGSEGQPFFGLLVASCERGDIRVGPDGLLTYGDERREQMDLRSEQRGRDVLLRRRQVPLRQADEAAAVAQVQA